MYKIFELFRNDLYYFNLNLRGRMMTEPIRHKQTKPKYAYDYLKLIDEAKDEEQEKLLAEYGKASPLNMLLSLNYNSTIELDFPAGAPPYKRDEQTHPDLMTALSTQIAQLKVCVKGHPAKRLRKEQVLIEMLECIPPCDADILLAAKDRSLQELFPNITKELVSKVFPQYVK